MALFVQLVDDVVVNKFELDEPELTIGRHNTNTIQIEEAAVSSHHARLLVEENKYLENLNDVFIEDLKSTNGTFVNDSRIEGRFRLNNNDVVRIAWNIFKYIDDTENTLEKTAHILQT